LTSSTAALHSTVQLFVLYRFTQQKAMTDMTRLCVPVLKLLWHWHVTNYMRCN